MARFIGREEELAALEEAYRKPGFQMAVVYGRRRIGKTTLLRRFSGDKRCVYYTAVKTTASRNAELFGQAVLEQLEPELTGTAFRSLEGIFDHLHARSREERLVVILDELPYFARREESLVSLLQKWIDEKWQFGQMFLILCGSSVSFMEDEVLSEKSPVFGRRTMQLRLEAFDYRQTGMFVPSWTPRDKAVAYGITGGVAKYVDLLEEEKSLDENICALYFRKTGYLYEEADNLLTQEFRDVEHYSRLIEALAGGADQVHELADKTGLSPQNTAHVLKNLCETGIAMKLQAITEEGNRKKTRYVLADEMLRFWYRFIPDAMGAVEIGKGTLYYERNVKPLLSDYMGSVFERICRQYTLSAGIQGRFACMVTRVGTWWGTNPAKRKETDIDVVGLDKRTRTAVIGECKFRNEAVDKSVFDALEERKDLLRENYRPVQFLLFSAGGFSSWIMEHREEKGIVTVSVEELYGQGDPHLSLQSAP